MSFVQQLSMPVPTSTPTSTAPQVAGPTRPRLRTVLRRVALSLTVACAIPAALFFTSYRCSGCGRPSWWR